MADLARANSSAEVGNRSQYSSSIVARLLETATTSLPPGFQTARLMRSKLWVSHPEPRTMLRQRQYRRPIGCNRHGVLEMGGPASIQRHGRPAIFEDLDSAPAEID